MAMPPSSFSCTAGLHEFLNSTLPTCSGALPGVWAQPAAARVRTNEEIARLVRVFMVDPPQVRIIGLFPRPIRCLSVFFMSFPVPCCHPVRLGRRGPCAATRAPRRPPVHSTGHIWILTMHCIPHHPAPSDCSLSTARYTYR